MQALTGRVRDHHRFLLRALLAHVDQLTEAITQLSAESARRLAPYAAALDLPCTLPGIKRRVAEVVLAELGTDLRRFADARHRGSWAASCPGDHESAGKRRSGRMRHGKRWLRGVLLQAARAAIKVRGASFGAQVRRSAERRGDTRAAIAVAHSLLTVLYDVLTRDEPYRDLGGDDTDRRKPE